jgi:hypothetical protein
MDLAAISAGAVITGMPGKSAYAANLRQDFVIFSIIVVVAIVLQQVFFFQKTIHKIED